MTSQLLERKDKKMTELEKIFDMYMEDKKDSEEAIKKDKSFMKFAKELNLKREEYRELEEHNVDCSIAYEKQGFINGFRYAVKLLAPIL